MWTELGTMVALNSEFLSEWMNESLKTLWNLKKVWVTPIQHIMYESKIVSIGPPCDFVLQNPTGQIL